MSRQTSIKAVIFDLFGTLVPPFSLPAYQAVLAEMASVVGLDYQAVREVWNADAVWDPRTLGQFGTVEDEVAYFYRLAGAEPSDEQVTLGTSIHLDYYRRTMVPRPNAVSTLGEIKKRGLRLALISDCAGETPRLWPELPFTQLIDLPLFSCTVRRKKPAPLFYRQACDGLGVEPGECMYVGDGDSRELAGATAVGMLPVLMAPLDEVPSNPWPNERDTWQGKRIGSLSELLEMVPAR